MVLYGDSHAAMWFQAIDDIAIHAHWKLVVLGKGACPAALLPTHAPGQSGDWAVCDQWHDFAVARIHQIAPQLLVVSQEYYKTPSLSDYSPVQWQRGLQDLFRKVQLPATVKVVLGNIPRTLGPDCLVHHRADVGTCSSTPVGALTPYNGAERAAVQKMGGRYIDVLPWFCANTCSPVIGRFDVYYNSLHVAVGYSRFLEGVLAEALDLRSLM